MKSYRVQGIECDKKGIRFSEHCIACGQEILMCKKYGGGCRSNKCLWSRLNLWERLMWNTRPRFNIEDYLEEIKCQERKHSKNVTKK